MQVKTFEAKDMASGLKLVKEAFGPDALILSTKTIKRGKMGLLSKPYLEITAAVDTKLVDEPVLPRTPKKTTIDQTCDDNLTYDQIWKTPAPSSSSVQKEATKETDHLKEEIADLKSTLKDLAGNLSTIQRQIVQPQKVTPYIEPEYRRPHSKRGNDRITSILELGIDHQTAEKVLESMEALKFGASNSTTVETQDLLQAAITGMITTDKVLEKPGTRQQRISLIGPTGVGKTTTIAKLAAGYIQQFQGKVALITIDTYRIAAVEQLKVYGEIMKLPVKVVIKPSEFEQALDEFRDYDLILIDTAGRSPNNSHDLQELVHFFRPRFGIGHHLLLGAPTRDQVLLDTINSFSILPIQSFIFSKIDECDQLGVMLNIQEKTKTTPLSFLTNGQRVPEDLITPNPATIAQLIVNTNRTQYDG